MILNLNQLTFQEYGTVSSERAKTNPAADKDAMVIRLVQSEAPVFRAMTDTRLTCSEGMCILSVRSGEGEYKHFYLDKTACIRRNTWFSLSAFKGEAAVCVTASEHPEAVGTRINHNLRIDQQLRVSGIYTFFYQEKEQGFVFSGESHPMPELTYVDQGELHSVVDGQDLLLKQGDVVIYGPNQWHMQYSEIGVAPRFVTISFDLESGDISGLLNEKFQAPQSAVSLLQTMLREQEKMDPYSSDMLISMLNLLLLVLLRDSCRPTAAKLQGTNVVHSENEIIRRAQQFVSEHIREKLSVPLVAKYVEVSPSYLTVLFHKNLQISPGEYIRRIKLQESKQMIRENNLNFTEIAAALQYSTVHHFSRQFKEKFGITPTEYAKSVR